MVWRWRNLVAGVLGVIGGVLLFLSQYSLGVVRWTDARQRVAQFVGATGAVDVVFLVVIAIASLGGLAAIAGALLIAVNRVRMGKLIILFAVGFGLISFLFFLWAGYASGGFALAGGTVLSFVGVALTIAARTVPGRTLDRRAVRPLRG